MKLRKTKKTTPKEEVLKKKKQIFKSTGETEKTTPKYSDIREVMDRTRPFALFYSGVENESYFQGCYNMGVRNFLMSYQYVRGRNITSQYKDSGISLFIDSGAYTYMHDPKFNDFTPEQWEKQIKEYLNWARKHTDMIFAMANLDLDFLVGSETVIEWNKKYFEPFMLETGIPVCFVYHETPEAMTWEAFCKRYPYVGISYATSDFDLATGKRLLQVAEKYDTLVHGMGMTKTSILPQLPFYTVDSTSWKSGFRYGQLAIWNGKKVQMFKKEDWESKALKYTRSYNIVPPLDEEKMYEFDEPEILRANVYAYMRAEEYIIEQLKPRMYWFKKKAQHTDVDNLPEDFFPPCEWFYRKGELPDLPMYAERMNVNPEFEGAFTVIHDMTTILNWENQEYESMKAEYLEDDAKVLEEVHEFYVNKISPDIETKVDDLVQFFRKCIAGEDETLLRLGTNFDRIVREREEYVTEEEYETEDLPDIEVQNVMSKYLPAPKEGSPAPEISDLDDEIFKENGIEPVRDENGHFLKGQHSVLKPKKMYSDRYPKMACDMCINAQRCPEYKAGYACAYNKMFERYNTRDMGDIIQAMQGITDLSVQRLQRAMVTETLQGGVPDPNVSQLMNQSMGLLMQLQRMYEVGNQEVIRQTKIMRADGTQEMTMQVSNPQQGGILERIFGNVGNEDTDNDITEEEKEEDIVEAQTPQEVTEEKED